MNDDFAPVRARIDEIRERRGYVLPSHAVLAVAAPKLMAAYEDVYREITYTFSALTALEKNFVWLVVIGCAETPTGAHHLTDFLDAGGTRTQVDAAARLALLAIGARTLDTVAPGWQKVMPEYAGDAAYLDAVTSTAAASGLAPGLVEMALAAGQACRRDWKRVEQHIVRAKSAGVADDALAEALTVCILPAGNPGFVQACGVWRKLILAGTVTASPAYRSALELC